MTGSVSPNRTLREYYSRIETRVDGEIRGVKDKGVRHNLFNNRYQPRYERAASLAEMVRLSEDFRNKT